MKFEELPKSATDFRIIILTMVCLFSLLSGLLIFAPGMDLMSVAIYLMTAVTAISVLGEIFIAKSHKAERILRTDDPDEPDVYKDKIRHTMLGFCGVLLLFLLMYLLIPTYGKDDYLPWNIMFLAMIIPSIYVAGFFYLPYAVKKLKGDNNYYLNFGYFIMGRFDKVDKQQLGFMGQSVLLRGFFMAFMFMALLSVLNLIFAPDSLSVKLFGEEFSFTAEKIFQVIMTLYFFMAILDVTVGMLGYICTFKGLNADIRSMDPTFLGWFSCVICYPPFWSILGKTILVSLYASLEWEELFEGHLYLLCFWGLLVLLSGGIEALSGATFGIRFSNIAYRGLITSGPYRYSKHPQYIAKMFHRTFTLLPFIGYASTLQMFQGMLAFGFILLLYFLRARTEENHLTAFPEYVAYANWMNENGIFRWIGKKMPVFAYDEERSKKYRIFAR